VNRRGKGASGCPSGDKLSKNERRKQRGASGKSREGPERWKKDRKARGPTRQNFEKRKKLVRRKERRRQGKRMSERRKCKWGERLLLQQNKQQGGNHQRRIRVMPPSVIKKGMKEEWRSPL